MITMESDSIHLCTRAKPYIRVAAVLVVALYLVNCIRTPDDFHFISGVNLIIHEAGHIIFIFFGEFMHILGGSLTQVLIPLIFVGYFFLRRDYFSSGVLLMWMGESISEVAHYAADAIVMQLPLLGGDSVIHDWNWLLVHMGVLKYTYQISGAMYVSAWVILLAGILVSLVSLYAKKSDYTT